MESHKSRKGLAVCSRPYRARKQPRRTSCFTCRRIRERCELAIMQLARNGFFLTGFLSRPMSNQANQHFVPQFFFKLFTGGDRRIHLLHKKDQRIHLNASIKGQCAHHRFYGDDKIETLLSLLEGQQSIVLKQLRDMAWSPEPPPLESHHLARVWEAVLLQRSRTELEVMKSAPAAEELRRAIITRWLRVAKPGMVSEALIEHLERGDIRIVDDPRREVAQSLSGAMRSTLLISDLGFQILRNRTDFPFLFSDAPVVFCNTYYQNVLHRGVLGYQTPGLQVFYPLDSRTLLMLVDDQIYGGRYRESLFVDVDRRCDVSQLNALQMHHSLNTIYFSNCFDQDYVTDLWNAHKHAIVEPRSRLENRRGWSVAGERVEDDIYHSFEPQLNFKLSLSFIECHPIHASKYKFRRRSPELYKELQEQEAILAGPLRHHGTHVPSEP